MSIMAKVKINGRDLHKVQMRLKCEKDNVISDLSYPEHRIKAEIKERRMTLKIPPLLVIELYRSGILPQDENLSMHIKIQNKDYGQWRITDLKYPDELYDDGLINIELTAQDKNE